MRVGDRDERRARLDHGLAEPGGAAGGAGAGRGDEEERLARIEDLAVGEQPVVMDDRADIVLAGNVGGGEDGDDAGRGPHRVEIERQQGRMAFGGMAEGEVEQARRLGQIVDIGRGAGDMEVGAVVRQRLVDGAFEGRRRGRSGQPWSTLTGSLCSAQRRRSRLAAALRR